MALVLLDLASPPPLRDVLSVRNSGLMSDVWQAWMSRLPKTLHAIPSILNVVTLEGQGAAITATDFSGTVLTAGLYRASYYARITTVAGVSSSLTVTLGWMDGGIALTQAGAAMVGNTTSTYQSGTVTFRSDAGEDVTYATAYASNTAGVMRYSLAVFLEMIRE